MHIALQTILTESAEEAAACIRRGELAAFPTETVYGLGGDAMDADAVAAIFKAKERPADNPLIAHVHSLAQLDGLAASLTRSAEQLIDAFFPGPLTVILKRASTVPAIVSAGLDTIAVRMPAHELALDFLKACDTPVAAPSANRSGRPSPTSWEDVYADLKGRIACILKGDPSEVGVESTVVDCTEQIPRILRSGGISVDNLRQLLPEIEMATKPEGVIVRSPGMKYRHYAPIAKVHLAPSPNEVPEGNTIGYIGLDSHPYPERLGMHLTCHSSEAYAHELFRFFRRCDRARIKAIYCQEIPRKGLGLAVMDRVERAASG